MNADPDKMTHLIHRIAFVISVLIFLLYAVIEGADFVILKWKNSECRKFLGEMQSIQKVEEFKEAPIPNHRDDHSPTDRIAARGKPTPP